MVNRVPDREPSVLVFIRLRATYNRPIPVRVGSNAANILVEPIIMLNRSL